MSSSVAAYSLEAPFRFHVFAGLAYVVALAYIVIGLYVLPILRLPRISKLLGTAFFLLCAAAFIELGSHAVADQPGWMMSRHAWALQATQAAVDWAFILSVRPWHRIRVAIVYREEEHEPGIEEVEMLGESILVDDHHERKRR